MSQNLYNKFIIFINQNAKIKEKLQMKQIWITKKLQYKKIQIFQNIIKQMKIQKDDLKEIIIVEKKNFNKR